MEQLAHEVRTQQAGLRASVAELRASLAQLRLDVVQRLDTLSGAIAGLHQDFHGHAHGD